MFTALHLVDFCKAEKHQYIFIRGPRCSRPNNVKKGGRDR